MTTQPLSAQDVVKLRTKIMKEEVFFGQERDKFLTALSLADQALSARPNREDTIRREARVAALEEAAELLHACALNLVGGRRTNHANRCSSALLVRLRDQIRALARQPAKDGQ